MSLFKRLLDFYLDSSIHTALSCYALVRMTQHIFQIHGNQYVAGFAFFGTIVGYNFVKYDALARTQKIKMGKQLMAIVGLSIMAFIGAAITFYQLDHLTQIIAIAFLALTLLYTLPFFPNKSNARNWRGIKIYIVAFCWVGVTLILPVLDAGIALTSDFYWKCLQRFLLLFVLIAIFEIIDLKNDDPNLQTVPQKIGVKRTKTVGIFLLLVFYVLEFMQTKTNNLQLTVNLILVVMMAFFLMFAHENRSKYYTSFWAESIPMIWYLMLVLITTF
ncbi:hypothetical protein [Flavobacterium sp.]|uniref:hypothetical protein n=1 Tax=Flavobacterium sp. TaxID=239 RepID=UPI0026131296|nr:hypothetical protein [Flavobacterium sp.]